MTIPFQIALILALFFHDPTWLIWWGAAQWAVLVPLCVWQYEGGYRLTAKGILITGCIGFLLDAGCAALIFGQSYTALIQTYIIDHCARSAG